MMISTPALVKNVETPLPALTEFLNLSKVSSDLFRLTSHAVLYRCNRVLCYVIGLGKSQYYILIIIMTKKNKYSNAYQSLVCCHSPSVTGLQFTSSNPQTL